MSMRTGERTIRGEIKRREEARRIYEAARNAGQVAALLDQERPNIFTQTLANLMPGATVEIRIEYVEPLLFRDGTFEFSFPTVVGPRFIPGAPTGHAGTGWAPDTTRVPDASRITPPVTPEGTRAGHDIGIAVDIDAGVPIVDVVSPLHAIDVERPEANRARVRLRDQAEIPNRDRPLPHPPARQPRDEAPGSRAHRRARGQRRHHDGRGGADGLRAARRRQPPARRHLHDRRLHRERLRGDRPGAKPPRHLALVLLRRRQWREPLPARGPRARRRRRGGLHPAERLGRGGGEALLRAHRRAGPHRRAPRVPRTRRGRRLPYRAIGRLGPPPAHRARALPPGGGGAGRPARLPAGEAV